MLMRRHWQAKIAQTFSDPHYAVCPTSAHGGIKPEKIDASVVGEHVSVVFIHGSGVRTYAFEGQKNRDRFVNLYRQYGARPVGDPLKGRTSNAVNQEL